MLNKTHGGRWIPYRMLCAGQDKYAEQVNQVNGQDAAQGTGQWTRPTQYAGQDKDATQKNGCI